MPDDEISGDLINVRLFEYDQNDICGANLQAMESHAAWVANAWGWTPSSIEYDLFGSRMHPCWPCPAFAGACSGERSVNTTRIPDRHEIAHASHGEVCPALIEEGWATLYANPFEVAGTGGSLGDAMASIEEIGYLDSSYYPFAARFVAFLIETRGMVAVAELCSFSIGSLSELNAALIQVVGMTADEVQQELDGYPAWTLGQLRQDQACDDLTGVPVSPVSWRMSLDCDNANVEGIRNVRVWSSTLVQLPEAWPVFEFSSPDDIDLRVEFRSCSRDGLASVYYDTTLLHVGSDQPAMLVKYDIIPGIYIIRLMAEGDALSNQQALEVDITVDSSLGP